MICWLGGNGCASLPYRYGNSRWGDGAPDAEVVYEYGKPQKTLDNIAWLTGIWSRILPLNSHVNNRNLTEETKEKLTAYLEENELTDVLIRVNQYDPKGEWRRLRENHHVAAGWRYSAGVISLIHYSVIPGRVFGGDQYNPFTNTLYLNSDVSAVVLHEAAYAKSIHAQWLPGSYAVVNGLPVMSLWRHTQGVNDILGYAQTNEDWTVERETYRVVYPQMGVRSMSLTGAFVPFWDGLLLRAGGAAAGHATGYVAVVQRTKERKLQQDSTDQPEKTAGASLDELVKRPRKKHMDPNLQVTDFQGEIQTEEDAAVERNELLE